MLQKLCSPTLVCALLNCKQSTHGDIEPVKTSESYCWTHASTDSFISSTERVGIQGAYTDSAKSELYDPGMHDPVQLSCAMLEVFSDEIILHSNLGKPILNSVMESSGSFPRIKKPSLCSRHMEVSLEAIFVHCLLSLSNVNISDTFAQNLFGLCSQNTQSPRISLPAAVLLLDTLVLIKAPQVFQAHVFVLVSKAIVTDSILTYGELPMEMTLSLHISVFETALKLYMKHSSLLKVVDEYEGLESPALESCLIKYRNVKGGNSTSESVINLMRNENICTPKHDFCSFHNDSFITHRGRQSSQLLDTLCMYIQKSKTMLDESYRDEICTTLYCIVMKTFSDGCKCEALCCVHGNVGPDTYLHAAILELMGCSLLQVVRMIKDKKGLGLSSSFDRYTLEANYDYTIDLMVDCFGDCLLRQPIGSVLNKIVTKVLARHKRSVGPTLSYFAAELCSVFETGSELLCKGYLSIMMSLMSLLVLEDGGIAILRALIESSELKVEFSHTAVVENISQIAPLKVVPSVVGEMAPRMSTLMIVKHFKKKQLQISSKNIRDAASKEEVPAPEQIKELITNNNSKSMVDNKFIESIIKVQGSNGEDFSDLSDFIVCKEGKEYSAWLEKRCRLRQRKYRREFFQRMQKRKNLAALLSMR
eukprot:Gb_25675 [translate_table: standard]